MTLAASFSNQMKMNSIISKLNKKRIFIIFRLIIPLKLFIMKKTLIFGAFAYLMMVSCSKDYSCKCVTTESSSQSSNTQTTTITGKKKDAEATCTAQNLTVGTYSKTCTLQ